MKAMSVSEVRNHLPEVVDEIRASRQAVVVTRHGEPVACIVPFEGRKSKANRYPLRGLPIKISRSFDRPMPEMWDALAK